MDIRYKYLTEPNGTFVTKYVCDDFYEDTTSGFLKFGSLSTYKAVEGETEGRMLDATEGGRTLLVKDPIMGQSVNLPNLKLDRCVVIGSGEASIAYVQNFNASVLCLVFGEYDKKHHVSFMKQGNESVTNFVTFDLHKLYNATLTLFSSILDVDAFLFGEKVTYVGNQKKEAISLNGLHSSVNTPNEMDFLNTIYRKPVTYSHENEFRIALHLSGKSKFEDNNIFVKDYLLTTASKLFKESIVDFGKV